MKERASLFDRLRNAWRAFTASSEHPQPVEYPVDEVPPFVLANGVWAKPLYEHWHPRGRNLYGWLLLTKSNHSPVGFVPEGDPGYGMPVDALALQAGLSPTVWAVLQRDGESTLLIGIGTSVVDAKALADQHHATYWAYIQGMKTRGFYEHAAEPHDDWQPDELRPAVLKRALHNWEDFDENWADPDEWLLIVPVTRNGYAGMYGWLTPKQTAVAS